MTVELNDHLPGFDVEVTVFRDDGWEVRPSAAWQQRLNKETLAEFLVEVARLPGPEAEHLAAEIQGPWREHWMNTGGKEYVRWMSGAWRVALPIFVLVFLLALVGVGLLAWLVVEAIS
jgi:hypothetical protein